MESPVSAWGDPQCAFRVEWTAPEKLDQVRIAVVDAFYALQRGGLEIGGVLLGSFDGKTVRVDDFVTLECEHLTGPSFTLSANDEAALEKQLELLGSRAIGWFHSHTRSEIQFSRQDAAVHNRFFPKPWQVGMVLRPANLQPLRANYFFRNESGAITGGGNTFTIDVMTGEKETRAPRNGPVTLSPPRPIPEPRQKPVAVIAPPPPVAQLEPVPEPDPVAAAPQPIPQQTFPQPPPKPALQAPPQPVYVEEPEQERKRSFLWPAAALALAALGSAAFFTREVWMPSPPATLGLRASDVDGNLIVRWNPVREGSTAELHIEDGGKSTDVTLDGAQLSHGLYAHARQATKETVRMKMGAREESIDFEGPLPKAPEPDPAAVKAKEEAERRAEKMRTNLKDEYDRDRQFQDRPKSVHKAVKRKKKR